MTTINVDSLRKEFPEYRFRGGTTHRPDDRFHWLPRTNETDIAITTPSLGPSIEVREAKRRYLVLPGEIVTTAFHENEGERGTYFQPEIENGPLRTSLINALPK